MDHFARDIAAISFVHPAAMRRRTEKGGTAFASLTGATTKQSLGRLLNASLRAHRNPDAPHMD
eukprot:4117161-Pyramimonas_sp.AAC.1